MLILFAVSLLFLNGCAVIRPVTQLVGGTLGVVTSVAGMAADTAIKAASVVLPLSFYRNILVIVFFLNNNKVLE